MRELVLVLPDLFPQTDGATHAVGAASMSLRFATPRVLRGGWRGMLARGVGRDDLALVDEASVIDAALRLGAGSASSAGSAGAPGEVAARICDPWIATPLHLMAGLKTVHFPANGLLRLETAEAAELAGEFSKIFASDGLELVPAGSAGFILRGLDAAGAETLDPARLVGGSLEESLPRGPGSAALRALASELEMWLHALPLNRRRAARGVPPISALWIWGGGQPPRDSLVPQSHCGAARWQCLLSDDIWVRSLGQLAGIRTDSPRARGVMMQTESCCLIVSLAEGGLEAIEGEFIVPLLRELYSGQLDSLVIATNDRWISLRAADRYKFWRPKRTILAAMSDALT